MRSFTGKITIIALLVVLSVASFATVFSAFAAVPNGDGYTVELVNTFDVLDYRNRKYTFYQTNGKRYFNVDLPDWHGNFTVMGVDNTKTITIAFVCTFSAVTGTYTNNGNVGDTYEVTSTTPIASNLVRMTFFYTLPLHLSDDYTAPQQSWNFTNVASSIGTFNGEIRMNAEFYIGGTSDDETLCYGFSFENNLTLTTSQYTQNRFLILTTIETVYIDNPAVLTSTYFVDYGESPDFVLRGFPNAKLQDLYFNIRPQTQHIVDSVFYGWYGDYPDFKLTGNETFSDLDGKVMYSVYVTEGINIGDYAYVEYEKGYDTGHKEGYDNGYANGKTDANNTVTDTSASYIQGYQDGANNAGKYTFLNLFSAIIDAPIRAVFGYTEIVNGQTVKHPGLLTFEVFGVDLSTFYMSLLTICLVLWIIRLLLGKV